MLIINAHRSLCKTLGTLSACQMSKVTVRCQNREQFLTKNGVVSLKIGLNYRCDRLNLMMLLASCVGAAETVPSHGSHRKSFNMLQLSCCAFSGRGMGLVNVLVKK